MRPARVETPPFPLFHLNRNDVVAARADFDSDWRTHGRPRDDFATNESIRTAAIAHQVVDRSSAPIDDHGVFGAKLILRAQRFKVGDVVESQVP